MRIVAVADTHMGHRELQVPDGDVFIHAGDLCRFGILPELEEAARWIRALPHRHKIVVAGNHDWAFVNEREAARALFDDVTYLEDTSAHIRGLHFYGSPWQPEFYNWAFNLPRGPALAEKWARIPPDVDVLITHGPPRGLGDIAGFGARAHSTGCDDLLARVRTVRPRLHMYGHIHEDGGVWHDDGTCFANVTAWDGERAPTVFDVDERTHVVNVVSLPPRHPRA